VLYATCAGRSSVTTVVRRLVCTLSQICVWRRVVVEEVIRRPAACFFLMRSLDLRGQSANRQEACESELLK
jgi:hypothetical protein